MIKSVVVSLVALSVAFVPVAAEARHRDNRDGNRWEHREKRSRISTGEAIAIGVGAFILGAAASRKQPAEREVNREVYDREYEYHYRRPVCREIISSGMDRYGDYYEKRTVRCN
jgi:Ni/Co efflux regulator RcnB